MLNLLIFILSSFLLIIVSVFKDFSKRLYELKLTISGGGTISRFPPLFVNDNNVFSNPLLIDDISFKIIRSCCNRFFWLILILSNEVKSNRLVSLPKSASKERLLLLFIEVTLIFFFFFSVKNKLLSKVIGES